MENRIRCAWADGDSLCEAYHDAEWGDPLHDDQKHFEFLSLEVMQCGLSWMTILRKRSAFQKAFDGFEVKTVATYGEKKIQELLQNPDIIRSEAKIRAIICNAQQFLKLQIRYGSFDRYIWNFVGGRPQRYSKEERQRPQNELSQRISKDLKKWGFKFLGPITLYSHLQAAGLINDHDDDCFKNLSCLGKKVAVLIDRPMGSTHPQHPNVFYPVNYGYVPGIFAPDGDEQDVYLLGVTQPVAQYAARIVAVIRRLDDIENKWVAVPEGILFTKEEIAEQVAFQEQYFKSKIFYDDTLVK